MGTPIKDEPGMLRARLRDTGPGSSISGSGNDYNQSEIDSAYEAAAKEAANRQPMLSTGAQAISTSWIQPQPMVTATVYITSGGYPYANRANEQVVSMAPAPARVDVEEIVEEEDSRSELEKRVAALDLPMTPKRRK